MEKDNAYVYVIKTSGFLHFLLKATLITFEDLGQAENKKDLHKPMWLDKKNILRMKYLIMIRSYAPTTSIRLLLVSLTITHNDRDKQ